MSLPDPGSLPALPSEAQVVASLEATWPPVAVHHVGPWRVREGHGGGKRVSCASSDGRATPDDIAQAEAAQAALGQPALFVIRPDETALDAALEARGYRVVDPVWLRAAAVDRFGQHDPVSAVPHWPALAIARDIWADTGIDAARIAVMERASLPKTALLGRRKDRAVGAAFIASHGTIAMVHALEVLPRFRRLGGADAMMRAAACWASHNGAVWLALAVTKANEAANALYTAEGLEIVGEYHYRSR